MSPPPAAWPWDHSRGRRRQPELIIAAADTVMNRSSSALLAEVFPGVPLTREVAEFARAGDRPRPAGDWLSAPAHLARARTWVLSHRTGARADAEQMRSSTGVGRARRNESRGSGELRRPAHGPSPPGKAEAEVAVTRTGLDGANHDRDLYSNLEPDGPGGLRGEAGELVGPGGDLGCDLGRAVEVPDGETRIAHAAAESGSCRWRFRRSGRGRSRPSSRPSAQWSREVWKSPVRL